MTGLFIILFWMVFVAALSFTVFSDIIPDTYETVITIITTPILAFSFGYTYSHLINYFVEKGQSNKALRIGIYLSSAVLAVVYLFFNKYSTDIRMGITVLLGFFAIGMTIMNYEYRSRYRTQERLSLEDWIFRGVWLVFVVTIITALISGKIANPVIAISIVLFGTLTLYFTMYTASFLLAGHSLAMESNWGGLGAGMGGWRVSRSMVFLFLAIFFGWSTVALIPHAIVTPAHVAITEAPSLTTQENVGDDGNSKPAVNKGSSNTKQANEKSTQQE
jgi:hypothetical protein